MEEVTSLGPRVACPAERHDHEIDMGAARPLAFTAGDTHEGTTPRVSAATHVLENGLTTSVTLVGLDLATYTLVWISPPNSGALVSIGALGVEATAAQANSRPWESWATGAQSRSGSALPDFPGHRMIT